MSARWRAMNSAPFLVGAGPLISPAPDDMQNLLTLSFLALGSGFFLGVIVGGRDREVRMETKIAKARRRLSDAEKSSKQLRDSREKMLAQIRAR